MKRIFSYFILGLILFGGFSLSACGTPSPSTNNTNTNTPVDNTPTNSMVIETGWTGLAKALTAAGAKMYGAYWCSHCQDQKEEFGDAFRYVTYVECAPDKNNPYTQSAACKAANIEGYPTWVFADGTRVESVMSFNELAAKINYHPAS